VQRWEIESAINTARSWALETFAAMTPEELSRPATHSGADHARMWSARDHFLHLAGPEGAVIEAIRRQLDGDEFPYPQFIGPDGPTPREEFLAGLNATNDAWLDEHAGYSFDEIVALGERQRAVTLELLAEATDEQLSEPLRNMPWSAFVGTLGELFALNARHAHGHHQQVLDGWAALRQPA
jgi:hypothetical protein